jgi:hypothetical protein
MYGVEFILSRPESLYIGVTKCTSVSHSTRVGLTKWLTSSFHASSDKEFKQKLSVMSVVDVLFWVRNT